MCTVVLLMRPGHPWPLVFAANRDEMLDRAWDLPAAHWPDQPGITAGRDRSGGGTWMGINRNGVVAAVLNRPGSLGPAAGKRSRGDLPLLVLAHRSAGKAAAAVTALDAGAWRSFNLVLADRAGAFFVRGLGHGRPDAQQLAPGLHMITAHDPDDMESPRVARHLARFRGSSARADRGPDPRVAGVAGHPGRPNRRAGRTDQCRASRRLRHRLFVTAGLPASGPPIWLFAAGPPHEAPFQAVP